MCLFVLSTLEKEKTQKTGCAVGFEGRRAGMPVEHEARQLAFVCSLEVGCEPGWIGEGLNGAMARITVGNSLAVHMLIHSRLVAGLWGR